MPSTPRSNQNRSTSSNSCADLRVGPVEVRLLGREQVQVPLAGRAVRARSSWSRRARRRSTASRSAAASPPGPRPGRNQNRSRSADPGPAASAAVNHGCRSEQWFGTTSMIDPDAERVRLRDQRVGVGEGAEDGVDGAVVGDVVAGVGHRRRVPRVEPDRVDAEVGEIGQPGPDAGQVADPVAVAVGEAAHVELVDRGARHQAELGHGSSMVARAQPLMLPAVRPDMMLRWKTRKNTIVGTAAIADAAMHQVLRRGAGGLRDADVERLPVRGVAVLDQQRPQEVLPDRDQGEDRDDADDRPGDRQHDPTTGCAAGTRRRWPRRRRSSPGIESKNRLSRKMLNALATDGSQIASGEPIRFQVQERQVRRRSRTAARRAPWPGSSAWPASGDSIDVAEHRPQLGQRVGGGHVEDELEGQRAERVVQRCSTAAGPTSSRFHACR